VCGPGSDHITRDAYGNGRGTYADCRNRDRYSCSGNTVEHRERVGLRVGVGCAERTDLVSAERLDRAKLISCGH
jgi:hypothetical protein